MATLSEYKSGPTTSLKRGTTNRSLGGTAVTPTQVAKPAGGLPGPIQKAADVGGQVGNVERECRRY